MTQFDCAAVFRQFFAVPALLLLLFMPATLVAAPLQLSLQSDTFIRTFERDTVEGTDEPVVPLYEYLRLDYGSLKSKGLSFHLYGWARSDLADSGFYEDTTDGELFYGYLQYRKPFSNFELRLGRQSVFTGVAVDSFDGLRIQSDLGPMFSLSVHGGQPVGYTSSNSRDGDLLVGGRFSHHRGTRYDIGLSYQVIRNDSDTVEEFAGVDLALALPGDASFFGFGSYNLETEEIAEQNYELRFNLVEIQFRVFFEDFSYQDYFPGTPVSPQPFRALATIDETLQRYGLSATRQFGAWEAGGKYTYYEYDLQDKSTDYFAVLLTWRGEGLRQIGTEIGYLDIDSIDDTQLLARLFGYWDRLPDNSLVSFVSGDIVHSESDQPFFGEDTTFFASIGAGRLLMDGQLELKISGDYTSGSYFKDDTRGLFTLTYRTPN